MQRKAFFLITPRLRAKAVGSSGWPPLGGRCYVSISAGQVECSNVENCSNWISEEALWTAGFCCEVCNPHSLALPPPFTSISFPYKPPFDKTGTIELTRVYYFVIPSVFSYRPCNIFKVGERYKGHREDNCVRIHRTKTNSGAM